MSDIYISLDAIAAYIAMGVGLVVLTLGLIVLRDLVSGERIAVFPFLLFTGLGSFLLLMGWRVLVLSSS